MHGVSQHEKSMWNFVRRIVGFATPLALSGPETRECPTTEDDIARESREIRALQSRLRDAIKEKALPALLEMMTDDVVLLTASGPPTVGRDAVKALCTSLFSRFDIGHSSEVTSGPVIGNAAINAGAHLTTLRPLDGGNPVTTRGRVVAVLRRENGVWKLARVLLWADWVDTDVV